MHDEQPGRDDIFPEWTVFDRDGGGYVAVHRPTGKQVEGNTDGELTIAIVAENVIRTWRKCGLL